MTSLPDDRLYNAAADFQLFDDSFFSDASKVLNASTLNEPSMTSMSPEEPALLDRSPNRVLYPALIEAKTEESDAEFYVFPSQTPLLPVTSNLNSDFDFSTELQAHSDSDAVWQPSQELMALISGDSDVFGLSLTNEAYTLANQQAAAYVYPVCVF